MYVCVYIYIYIYIYTHNYIKHKYMNIFFLTQLNTIIITVNATTAIALITIAPFSSSPFLFDTSLAPPLP